MKRRGFTLLEMVIAIAIFAVIATLSYGALIRFSDSYASLSDHHERLKQLHITFSTFERDVRYFASRSVRDEYGDSEDILIANPLDPPVLGEVLRLTVSNPNPALRGTQQLTRVAWRFDDGKLYRVSWPVLDRPSETEERRRLILDGVAEFTLRFVGYDEQNELTVLDDWTDNVGLPAAVELSVTPVGGDSLRRLFALTHNVAPAP